MISGKVRMAKCKAPGCSAEFIKRTMGHKACSAACAIALAKIAGAKTEKLVAKIDRARDRARRECLKTRRDWIKDAQVAFNAYIRERDIFQPCICCGKPLILDAIGGGYDCGHYRSTGSAPQLRFNEDNAHAQRKVCNRHGAGRAVDYRIGLVSRIGIAAVEALESDNSAAKWSIEEIKKIRDTYRGKLKELRNQRERKDA